jgi:hypothetical protein
MRDMRGWNGLLSSAFRLSRDVVSGRLNLKLSLAG